MTPARRADTRATLREFTTVPPDSGLQRVKDCTPGEPHMHNWKNRPPAPNEFGGIRLIRVPKGKTLELIITSNVLVGADTHFTQRRTVPCDGPSCAYCLDGSPTRWHGYVSICSTRLTSQAVLELTSLAAQPIIDYQDRHGSLRGARLRATRVGNHDNSPVHCSLEPADIDLRTLPTPVHLENFLSVIWHLDGQPSNSNGKPPRGPNTRNTPDADTPPRTPQPENPEPDPNPETQT